MNRLIRFGIIAVMAIFLAGCAADDPANAWLLSMGLDGTSSVTVAEAPADSDFAIDVNDVIGDSDFIFDSTNTISLFIYVRDFLQKEPIEGTLVQIDERNVDGKPRVIFYGATDKKGNLTGSFTVNSTTNLVFLTVNYMDQTYYYEVDITGVREINRTLYMTANITPTGPPVIDSDGDGIPDDQDAFPNDPTRAKTIVYPMNTIAFEDLYPQQGDADFNDFVIQAAQEEDLNGAGEVARIRGSYRHVAKGAGYNHMLHVNLPAVEGATVNIKRYTPEGVLVSDTTEHKSDLTGLMLMPRSDTTIPASNTGVGDTFQPGDLFEFEIILDSPVNKLTMGPPPYDLYLYVIRTFNNINGVYLTVRSVEVHSQTEGWIKAVDYGVNGKVIDLLKLYNGIAIDLEQVSLKPGQYNQVRLILDGNSQVEVKGNMLPLKVPSGETSGLKLTSPFTVSDNGMTTVRVNFDLRRSLFRNGRGDYILKPTIEVVDSVTVQGESRTFINLVNPPEREIHFAGLYFNEDGTDKYLDENGFPWALKIPGNWKWMYERENIHNGYEFFDDWYMSDGTENKDWYNFVNTEYVFPYVE